MACGYSGGREKVFFEKKNFFFKNYTLQSRRYALKNLQNIKKWWHNYVLGSVLDPENIQASEECWVGYAFEN